MHVRDFSFAVIIRENLLTPCGHYDSFCTLPEARSRLVFLQHDLKQNQKLTSIKFHIYSFNIYHYLSMAI